MRQERLESPLAACVDAVRALFEPVLADLGVLARQVSEGLTGSGEVTVERLEQIVRPGATAMLGRRGLLGAGLVPAPGAGGSQEVRLVWWEGRTADPLPVIVTAFSGTPVDLTRQDWYRLPAATGDPHVTAPYVGYLRAGDYVVTCSVPVTRAGALLGVVGADTLVETLESALCPILEPIGAAVVHEDGRCVVAADPDLVSGRSVDAAAFSAAVPCGDLPLRVLARGTGRSSGG